MQKIPPVRCATILLGAILLWHPAPARAAESTSPAQATAAIPAEWLGEKLSVEQAEARYPGVDGGPGRRSPGPGKPFGALNGDWEALKAEMKPGDEIWTFASPAATWQDLAGRAGIVLVRSGRPIRAIVTMLN